MTSMVLQMPSAKTAISLDRRLLDRLDAAARELDLPRSRLLARAAEEYLRRHENQRLLTRLNRVYGEDGGEEERALARRRRGAHRRRVEGDW